MKLEHISAVLRPRSDAEAVDLGLAMVRQHAAGVYKAWFSLLIPLWLVLGLALHNYPTIMVLIAWWLKPVYDRVVTLYLGRALFGAAPTLREQAREWRRLLTKRLIGPLIFGRLSTSRSFTLPVIVLEGLTGAAYKSRTAILNRHGGGAAFGFMQLFMLLEFAVVLGLWGVVGQSLPEIWAEWMENPLANLQNNLPPPEGLLWSVAACYLVAVAVMEPFYAGGGFGLYINSRTHLEGWDVDLAFRQLGNRLRARQVAGPALPDVTPAVPLSILPITSTGPPAMPPPPVKPPALGVIGLLIFCLLTTAPPAPAVEKEAAKQQIKEVLAHPDFTEHVKKHKQWDPDFSWLKPKPSAPSPEPAGWDWGWMQGMAKAVIQFFSGDWKDIALRLFWTVVIAATLAWLGRLLWRAWKERVPSAPRPARDPGPRVVMGMEITPESLPPDIPTAAWQAWQNGDPAGAVRLLYRGSLSWLMEQGTVPIRESDTEGDCLRHAGALPDAGRRAYFADLTNTWLATAYGKTPPASDLMRHLCDRWPFSLTTLEPAPNGTFRTTPALLILLTTASLFLTGCRFKDVETPLGHQGEARRNPWLAATRFLEANNYPVLTARGVLTLPESESILFIPANAIHSAALARHVIDWTRDGGHVVYLAEGGEQFRSDWNELADFSMSGSARQEMHPLLTEMGITVDKKSSTPSKASSMDTVNIDGTTYRMSLAEHIWFDVSSSKFRVLWNAGPDKKNTPLASMKVGEGQLTILAHAHAFRNRWIDDDDHAPLLLALVESTNPVYNVHFFKSGRVSLWDMLWEHAWPALIAVVVLLLVWLWSVMPRFGPVLTLPWKAQRRFAGHLEESGAYLWKQGLTDALLQAPRQAVLTAARRQGYHPEERLFASLLATRAGLPVERVTDAIHGGNAHDARLLTRQIADLQTILTSLAPSRVPA